MTDANRYILKVACEDRPGIVAAVARTIAENGGNILECQQFDDAETGAFQMRILFSCSSIEQLSFELKPTIQRFDMKTELVPEAQKGRVIIMVSKMDHCMNDILYRWRKGDLNMDLVAIVSNHETYRAQVEQAGLTFIHIPITKETKLQAEKKLLDVVNANKVDLVVLARYMQILSDDLSKRLFGKVINIHHSFLPSFKGAKAYHQAHARGVKLIGATAHYVTRDLDEGPIIEQEVARVTHSDTAEDHVRLGRDVECRVLSRAVRWHLEHRVFVNKGKTVVFK